MTNMNRALIIVVIVFLAVVASCSGMAIYDVSSRAQVSSLVDSEMSPQTSISQMEMFMREHTVRSVVDYSCNYDTIGFMKQSIYDRIMYRQVRIQLSCDPNSRKYTDRHIEIFYTWP